MVANNTKLSEKLRTWRTSALQLRKHALELEVRQFICPPSTFQCDAVQVILREDFDFSCSPMPIIPKKVIRTDVQCQCLVKSKQSDAKPL